MNQYKQNKYLVVKEAITKEIASLCYDYITLKKTVYNTLIKSKRISDKEFIHGLVVDEQSWGTYSIYGDPLMEVILARLISKIEKHTDLKLIPTYSYARMYTEGDQLDRHKDRFSCEISATLNLGGDLWPIYLDPNPKSGYSNDYYKLYVSSCNPGIEINLSPGDMLLYSGYELEHWRNEFTGKDCAQVFLHYNIDNEEGRKNIFDTRPHLGLPTDFQNEEK